MRFVYDPAAGRFIEREPVISDATLRELQNLQAQLSQYAFMFSSLAQQLHALGRLTEKQQ